MAVTHGLEDLSQNVLELFWLESEYWDLNFLLGSLILRLKYVAVVFDKFF
jgi:hypothetical protein